MTVETCVQIYETDGKRRDELNPPMLIVKSHWNFHDEVVIEVDGKCYSVIASQLQMAVANATNWK